MAIKCLSDGAVLCVGTRPLTLFLLQDRFICLSALFISLNFSHHANNFLKKVLGVLIQGHMIACVGRTPGNNFTQGTMWANVGAGYIQYM